MKKLFWYLMIPVTLLVAAIAFLVFLQLTAAGNFHGSTLWNLSLVQAYLFLALVLMISISLIICVVALIYFAIKYAVVNLSSSESLSAIPSIDKLIALAVTLVVFSEVVGSLFTLAFSIGSQVFINIPRGLFNVTSDGFRCISDKVERANQALDRTGVITTSDSEILSCYPYILDRGFNAIDLSIDGLLYRSGLIGFEIQNLMIAVVLFFLIAIFLGHIIRKLNLRSKFWLAYGSITVVSIYLALSATLAIALMNSSNNSSEELSTEKLQTHLEKISVSLSLEHNAATEPRAEDPRSDPVKPSAARSPENSRILRQIDWVLEDFKSEKTRLARRLVKLEQAIPSEMEGLRVSAVELYEKETEARLGTREAARHYLSIVTWYRTEFNRRKQLLANCQSGVDSIQGLINEARVIARTVESSQSTSDYELERLVNRRREVSRTGNDCSTYQADSRPPARPAYGTSLGLVGSSTQWLLGAESLPVTVITGLVGFGLLGALVSRFVRKQEGEDDFETFGQIASLVCSGFVAALVVYLGAYGGITIVSETPGDPNPYVVFAACLVGAVYSPTVWERAKSRFEAHKNGDADDEAAPSSGPGQTGDTNPSTNVSGSQGQTPPEQT